MKAPEIRVVADKTLKIRREFTELQRWHVVVGVPEKTATLGREVGQSNATLANIHENGSPARGIPPRPFLRVSLEKDKPNLIALLNRTSRDFCDGKIKVDATYTLIGLHAQNTIKAYLRASDNFTPLKEGTLAARKRRGFIGEKPLIETGQLLNSIDFDVRRRE